MLQHKQGMFLGKSYQISSIITQELIGLSMYKLSIR